MPRVAGDATRHESAPLLPEKVGGFLVGTCAPWRSACTSWAASSSARPSSAARLITPLLLLEGAPPVGAPATYRARTLRKGISSLQTGITSVRQAYDGRPVRSRRRLLRFPLGGVGIGLHLYSLPWVWPPHQCQAATHYCILYNILQLYHQESLGGGKKPALPAESRSLRALGPRRTSPGLPPRVAFAENATRVFATSALSRLR